jgi:hypothetical protein
MRQPLYSINAQGYEDGWGVEVQLQAILISALDGRELCFLLGRLLGKPTAVPTGRQALWPQSSDFQWVPRDFE